MSVVEVLNVKLQRADPSVSWGFNVQGGKEFGSPLVIQKVNPGSLADRCSIKANDYILRVGSLSTEHLSHNQCRDSIVRQGNNMELTLQRGAPPRSDDFAAKLDFPQHQLMNPESLQQPTASPQVGVQLSKNKALLTQSYNSPMGLYSSQNIADSLVTSMKGVPDFTPVRPPPPPPVAAKPQYQPPMQQYHPPMNQQPRSTYTNAPSPAGPPKPKNYIGGNRGALGSHLMNMANPNHIPTCNACHQCIRGPFISAIGKTFCPSHFVCQHPSCGINLETCGFVEEDGKLYCEKDFQQYFAPTCFKCKNRIMGECCNALEKSFHPECFTCAHCRQKLGSGTFHIEDGLIYCPKDFQALFAQKCAGCDFPIEAGDQFFEAINQLWHCECFTCQTCHVQLKASGFCVKGVKPYCKKHAF